MPVRSANRSKSPSAALPWRDEQVYSHLMLKTWRIDRREGAGKSKWSRRNPADWGKRGESYQMGKAATLVTLQPSAPAREPTAWMHAPSQPLMRSLLSQFQTPTAPRRVSRFFRVRLLFRSPRRADHSAYFGLASFISLILSAVDVRQTK